MCVSSRAYDRKICVSVWINIRFFFLNFTHSIIFITISLKKKHHHISLQSQTHKKIDFPSITTLSKLKKIPQNNNNKKKDSPPIVSDFFSIFHLNRQNLRSLFWSLRQWPTLPLFLWSDRYRQATLGLFFSLCLLLYWSEDLYGPRNLLGLDSHVRRTATVTGNRWRLLMIRSLDFFCVR